MIVEAERGRTSRRQPRLLATAGAGVVLALALAACSSSSGKSSSSNSAGSNSAGGDSSSAGSACMAAAQSFLTPWDTLPSTLDPAYTPLAKKPEAGKTVIKLVGPIPSDNDSYGQQAVAAQSVRWTAKKITFDGTVEDLNAKFEQAISQKPAAITLSGWPPAAIQKPLADAAKAGVVVGLSSVVDEPSGYPGYASNTNGAPTAKQIGELNAYQFMRASKCDGTAAIFNLPFPILKIATDSFNSTVKANCPDCKVSYNEIQTKDIGTPAATNSIVSKLQSSPSTKYVYTIIGNVASGLSTAINQAGLSGIKIFGQVPDENSIGALRNKSNAWWVDQNSLMNGWTEFDGILRAIDTGKTVSDNGHYPLGLLTPDNVGSGTSVPVLPTDYQTEFKKLWRVG
jgi:ABC-type sugar transport system substrate-binding protein